MQSFLHLARTFVVYSLFQSRSDMLASSLRRPESCSCGMACVKRQRTFGLWRSVDEVYVSLAVCRLHCASVVEHNSFEGEDSGR